MRMPDPVDAATPLPHSTALEPALPRPTLAAAVRWRLAAPCVLLMLLSSLDRANISFAALQMNSELGLLPTQYGLVAGLVFAGFLAGQYPSVLLYLRLGMHRWISTCAILWGAAATGMAAAHSAGELYTLRIILGLAEGGLAPGIVLYLSQFVAERDRATAFALPMLAIPLSVIIGGPLSGWLMQTPPSAAALSGWRWMLLAEGLPTVLFGAFAFWYFPDRPAQARWLSEADRRWLALNAAIGSEADRPSTTSLKSTHPDTPHPDTPHPDTPRATPSALRLPRMWACAALWFCLLSGSYGVIFWLPQLIKALTDLNPLQIGVIGALPWAGALLAMYANAKHSDRTGERFWHIAVPTAISGIAFLTAWLTSPGIGALIALTIGGVGLGAAQGAFWALPTRLLPRPTLPMAVVTINIAGSAGGLVMPHLMGWARQLGNGFGLPTGLLVATLLIGALLVLVLRLTPQPVTRTATAP